MTYDWIKLKKELEQRLEKAVPADLKDFVGLVDAKGYCDLCRQKKVLFYNRATKKSLCDECHPAIEMEYTAIEFNNMWQLVQDTMYYTNEIIMELMYPNIDFSQITPEKMKNYLLDHGWTEKPFECKDKNENVWRFSKDYKSPEKVFPITVFVPNRSDLIDYHRAVEIVIETVSKLEKTTPYEVFQRMSSL